MALEAPPYAIAVWRLDPGGLLADPGAGEWRVNFDDGIRILLSETDALGENQAALFAQLVSGDRLVVQQYAAALQYAVVDIGTPVDHTGWWELPVLTVLALTTPAIENWVFIFRHAVGAPAWATVDDVTEAVGLPVDAEWVATCTDAANAWAFRKREQAGYLDDPDISPGPDVSMGTVLMAKALYQQRGSVDGFQSFQQLETFVPSGTLAEVRMMLGIGKPMVA